MQYKKIMEAFEKKGYTEEEIRQAIGVKIMERSENLYIDSYPGFSGEFLSNKNIYLCIPSVPSLQHNEKVEGKYYRYIYTSFDESARLRQEKEAMVAVLLTDTKTFGGWTLDFPTFLECLYKDFEIAIIDAIASILYFKQYDEADSVSKRKKQTMSRGELNEKVKRRLAVEDDVCPFSPYYNTSPNCMLSEIRNSKISSDALRYNNFAAPDDLLDYFVERYVDVFSSFYYIILTSEEFEFSA